MVLLLLVFAAPSGAQVNVQCPCDRNADGDCEDIKTTGPPSGRYDEPDLQATLGVQCMHVSGGDGFATMADGKLQYIFSFSDVTGEPEADAMAAGTLAAAWPAPAIAVDQGIGFYLTLTNVGMLIRPDLFDPHTVHFHGFPNASSVFDGVPDASISINMGASLTYYYNLVEPGTFMYHCHVEATEHMQMGMLGNLYVRPIQNRCLTATAGAVPCPPGHVAGDQYVYNDGDRSTLYDVEYPIQLGGFDPEFHDASLLVQPLPFAMMWDRYPMLNGRGYPDTINTGAMPQPLDPDTMEDLNGVDVNSQVEPSLIEATVGDKILLRLSNLNITVSHNLISPSIPMRVVGIDSRELRTADGTTPLHYLTNSVKLGGGMSTDVILDTNGADGMLGTPDDVVPGTYYLYAANLNYLSNYNEDFGGMMTEIVISP
jgi:FtsP/CotA-like multicopper oxidase with cupredoxin domain